MANEQKRNAGSNPALEETLDLLKNRMNMQPKGCMFVVNSDKIEDCILDYFESHGVHTHDENVYVKVFWNHKYDSQMRTGRNDGNQMPFHAVVVTQMTKTKQYHAKNRAMQAIYNNMDTSGKAMINLIDREELNKACASLGAHVDKKQGTVEWDFAGNKKQWVQCALSTEKILELIFALDEMKRKVNIDILSRNVNKKDGFVMNVLVQYPNEKYKTSKFDVMKLIHR